MLLLLRCVATVEVLEVSLQAYLFSFLQHVLTMVELGLMLLFRQLLVGF